MASVNCAVPIEDNLIIGATTTRSGQVPAPNCPGGQRSGQALARSETIVCRDYQTQQHAGGKAS